MFLEFFYVLVCFVLPNLLTFLFHIAPCETKKLENDMTSTNSNTGSGLSAENAMDLTSSPQTPACSTEISLDLTLDEPKTPVNQLQKVFDLSKESSEATYEWMRFVPCRNIYCVNFSCPRLASTSE